MVISVVKKSSFALLLVCLVCVISVLVISVLLASYGGYYCG